MSGKSIEHITKKHFRSGLSIFNAAVTVAIAAASCCLTAMDGFRPFLAVFSGFTVLSALFTMISIFFARAGCTLMRISVALSAVVCFFSGMGIFTLAYLFIKQNEIQELANELLSGIGFNTIATEPFVTGTILYVASILLYLAFGCSFFGHRYLGAAKSCAAGTLKRSGFRIYPILSVVLFVLTAAAAACFMTLSSESFINDIISDTFSLIAAALIALILLHLLLSGICAGAFARKTFAFILFEKQIMKVETNADGTVYVPINEDKEPDEDEPLLPAKKKTDAENKKGKPFITEYTPAAEQAAEHSVSGEGSIL